MAVNDISKEMYKDVPKGEALFIIDKIGLQLQTKYINKNEIEQWKKSNVITILTFGETSQINIHAEFEPGETHLGKRCFDAVLLLLVNRVFNSSFSLQFLTCLQFMLPYILFYKSSYVFILSNFFKIVEWEWAWDFLDNKLYSYIDNEKGNNKNFKKYLNSNYSKDGKVIKRIKERDGKLISLSKGRQQSLVNIYNRGKKIESERKIERVEVRQQGKYKNDLSIDLLNGSKEEAVFKALPVLKKSVSKVIRPEALQLNDYWKKNASLEFIQIFSL